MKQNIQNGIVLLFRIVLGVMFIYASWDKIAYPAEFAKQVGYYQVLPFGLENIMAIVLPWMELITGLCILGGLLVDGAVVISMVMMLVFILAVSQAMLRGIDITCGCFKLSTDSEKLGLDIIIRDIVFFIMSFVVLNRRQHLYEYLPKYD